MASAGTVTVDFAAETAKFTAELKKVNDRLKSMESGFKSLESIAKSALGFLTVSSVAGFAKGVFEAANELDRLQQKTGIAVESLSRLQFIAGQADTDFQALTTAVTQFQKRLGSGDANEALNRIGVSLAQIKDLSPEQQLVEISRGFQSIENPAKRVALSMELFGKAGADLLPFLLTGPEGIKKLAEESDRLGATMDSKTVAALDRTEKQVNKLKAAVSGLTAEILAGTSILLLGREEATQAEQFNNLVKERIRLQERLAHLQNQSGIENFLVSDAVRAKGIESVNKQLEENARLIADIQQKERQRREAVKEPIVPDDLLEIQRELGVTTDKARQLQQEFRALLNSENGITIPQKKRRIPGQPENFDDLAAEFRDKELEDQKKFNEKMLQDSSDFLNKSAELQIKGAEDLNKEINRIDRKRLDRQFEMHQEYLTAKRTAEETAIASSVGLLSALAGKSRAAAIALIAVEKGLAIARVIQSTAAGVMAVFADPTIPYFAKPALAAHVRFLGAVNVGLIAATGAVQASQVGSGGASLGSSANPVFTSRADTSFSTDTRATADATRTVQVILNGPVYGLDDFNKRVIDAIGMADESDVQIIKPNGATGQSIRAAA